MKKQRLTFYLGLLVVLSMLLLILLPLRASRVTDGDTAAVTVAVTIRISRPKPDHRSGN
ncbi:MAG: hypothetical protein R2867_21615 [Caldilineaceae bacterium]